MLKIIKEKIGIFCILSLAIGSIFTMKEAGWLQPFEWAIFDLFVQMRPQEPVDKRIVIVALEETDIKKLKYPISDRILADLLTKIKSQKPTIIGLDIYRDEPVLEGHDALVKVFKTTPNLIGMEKRDVYEPVAPPPALEELGQISTVDVRVDSDRKLRRVLLYPQVEGKEPIPNLGLALAYRYLKKQGIDSQQGPNDFLQLKNTVFVPLQEDDGGYVNVGTDGYQMLINYRGPARSFVTVSFSDVLDGQVPPSLMRGRIVLVGSNAESVKDIFFTPYSQNLLSTPEFTSGVEVVANITSSIIASVLDNRPLFKFLPEEIEYLIVVFITIFAITLLWIIKPKSNKDFSGILALKLFSIPTFIIIFIFGFSYLAFLSGLWIPAFLPISQLLVSSLIYVGYIYFERIKLTTLLLKQKNKDLRIKQVELEKRNLELEEKTLALHESQASLVLALDAATTAIWDWDLREDEICIIHNCDKLLGWGNDCGRISYIDFLTECVKDEDRNLLVEKIGTIIDDVQTCQFDFRVNRLYDDNRYLEVKGKVDYDSDTGKAIRMLGILSDVTQRKVSGVYAAETNLKYETLVKNGFDIGMLLNENLDFRHVSPAIKRILGYDTRDLDWQNIIEFLHPKDAVIFKEVIEKVSQTPGSVAHFKYRHLHKDKTWRTLESVVYNALHEPAIRAFVINSHDVTELVQIQQQFG